MPSPSRKKRILSVSLSDVVNEAFAQAIGADAYCRDAAVAVEIAKELVARHHNIRGAAGG